MKMAYELLALQLDPNRRDGEGRRRMDGGVEENEAGSETARRKRGREEGGSEADGRRRKGRNEKARQRGGREGRPFERGAAFAP